MAESLADGPDWHLRSESRSGLPLFSAIDIWFGSLVVFSMCSIWKNLIPEDAELMKKLVDVQKRFLMYRMYP